MCCVCGGGQEIFNPLYSEVSSIQDILEQADGAGQVITAIIHHPEVLFRWFGNDPTE
jgi:hypothetical protein